MRERPILFSAAMVRAILDGRKTQTRRALKPQPDERLDHSPAAVTEFLLTGTDVRSGRWEFLARASGRPVNAFRGGPHCVTASIQCPYGSPGDRLWVRETCRAEELSRPSQVRPATARERRMLGRTNVVELDDLDGADGVRYLADDAWAIIKNTPEAGERWSDLYHYGKLRGGNVPAIHMPRWASRITLEITGVRVERLNDISEADAQAEGAAPCANGWWFDSQPSLAGSDARGAYYCLWESINAAGSWAANPWVWVVEFRRVDVR